LSNNLIEKEKDNLNIGHNNCYDRRMSARSNKSMKVIDFSMSRGYKKKESSRGGLGLKIG
jgi:hypothetical protein